MDEDLEPFPRAWIEFEDPDNSDQIVRADLTWLTSSYTCIYGRGCQSIDASIPYGGCCTHGAHFAGKADRRRVTNAVAQLTPAEWQRHPGGDKIRKRDWLTQDDDGEHKTQVTGGACVFLNDPEFPRGAGCALHVLAERLGESHVTTKPDVCWQLPIRRDYENRETADGDQKLVVVITEYTRAMWGPGGHEFDWYCTNEPAAHVGSDPLYLSSADELRELLGAAAYQELCRHCEAFDAARAALRIEPVGPQLAGHPADQ
ncbi:MAG: hypothetical protein K0U60_09280 [Actinomycetia bacterium]|nr:hypothetical protein [Actinomycetes bacterium]MCH9800884.1 hypothetical protein [Actinomycetes bacterium]